MHCASSSQIDLITCGHQLAFADSGLGCHSSLGSLSETPRTTRAFCAAQQHAELIGSLLNAPHGSKLDNSGPQQQVKLLGSV